MKNSKGQISLEFVTSTLFVIFVLAFILFTASDQVPDIESNNERASVNMEAWQMTSMLLDSPGYHSYGEGGTDWEKNQSTLENIEDVGLTSDYHVVEREKIMAMDTIGEDVLNYSRFRDITGIDHQYRISFTAMPTVDTSSKYLRSSPPDDPNIVEPVNPDYESAGNLVGYGSIVMGGTQYNVLTTSHDGSYDTLYIVNNSHREWNFVGADRYEEGDDIMLGDRQFEIEGFHNTVNSQGNVVILSKRLNTFGSEFDVDSTIIKLDRYAALKQEGAELQPLRIEVFSWA